jgi:glycosyltransferase involved in cell wall biosynthesis
MRDVIVFSTWGWETFNVPERIAVALAMRDFRVLYCAMPVSRFRGHSRQLREVYPKVHAFVPEYLGAKFRGIPAIDSWQWKLVASQIQQQSISLGMKDALFLYSHVNGIGTLCKEMRAMGSRLVHICMDYPEPYQYDLIALSQRTLVIPKTVFHKLRARYGEKIFSIPQSIHLNVGKFNSKNRLPPDSVLQRLTRPRLGYMGSIFTRLNLPLLRSVLQAHPDWQFICFGDISSIRLPNVHGVSWCSPDELPLYIASIDAGVMPYDCFEEKNLHCVPLKLFDYFAAGLPVVSTPVISLKEFSDLIYFGDTPESFTRAIERALSEPADSPHRKRRVEVAFEHSTEALGRRLEEVLNFD